MFKYSKKILSIALPAMAENILQTLMGVVDSYLIAQLGLIAISGVSVATNLLAIYQALFIALGTAISSLIARNRRDSKKLLFYQRQAVILTVLLSGFLGILAIFGSHFIWPLLGVKGEVLLAANRYFAIVGGGAISLGLLTSLGAILRSQGNPRIPMYVSLTTNILNALLSALSVFVWDFGITGVALATVLSRFIGIIIITKQLPTLWSAQPWSWGINRELLSLSLPAAGERLMMRAGDIVVLSIIIPLGTIVVSGNAIGETLTQFNYLPGVSIATAVVILIGTLSDADRKQLIRTSYVLALILMLLVSGLVLVFGPTLIAFFTENSSASETSELVLLASFLGTTATAGTLVYTAVWQGVGNAKLPFYATTIGMWCVRVLFAYLIVIVLHQGFVGIWIATILDNLFRWLVLSYIYRRQGYQNEHSKN
ncbi:MATE family efflux transporter [Streptococcus hillyeri]|uniref:Probable multidrug resistance protein NorM n=1 Tax=Streptococcus hillyeri TaxID=2282420 RepID=A0A3L9DV99_9STRE|nr:MATE family efflux transporter [Streptococcus hillyeri]RLY02690.1 MATE family efflux transporter [Streptococcus hillyeri]